MDKKKSNLKAHCKAGPKSPKRISAKKAALPSAFYEHDGARLLHSMFSESELESVRLRLLIGELCAAILSDADSAIVQCFQSLSDYLHTKENATPRLELCAFLCANPRATHSTPGFERFLPPVEPKAPRKSRARKHAANDLQSVVVPCEPGSSVCATPGQSDARPTRAGLRSVRRQAKRQQTSSAKPDAQPEGNNPSSDRADGV